MTLPAIGSRVLVNDSYGTVRWIGQLAGLDSERAGVELDSPEPDRHCGEYEGSKVFDCAKSCGVFVKLSKLSLGRSCEEVVRLRYLEDTHYADSNLVGGAKLLRHLSDFSNIHMACLERGGVAYAGNLSSLKNLRRMRLSENLITNCSVVYDIVSQLGVLEELDLTGNRLSGVSNSQVLPSLQSLVLCRTGLDWDSTIAFIKPFTNLHSLNLEGNSLSDFNDGRGLPTSLRSLDLSSNSFSSWKFVSPLPLFLTNLDISQNPLCDPTESERESLGIFFSNSQLSSLSVAGTKISDFKFFRDLSESPLKLTSLRVTDCPFYADNSSSLIRQVLIAIFPKLITLNGASVSKPSLRLNAERYCAASAEVERLQWIGSEKLNELRNKHGLSLPDEKTVEERANMKNSNSALSLRIQPLDGKAGTVIALKVMPSLTIGAFKRLIAKRGKWPMDIVDLEISWKSAEIEDSLWEPLQGSDEETVGSVIYSNDDEVEISMTVKGK